MKRALLLCVISVIAVALGGCEPPLRPAVVGRSTPIRIAALPVVRAAEDRTGQLTEVLGGPRPVVIAFFTTWCPVSRPTLLALERVASQYRDGVNVVAVGMDAEFPEIAQFVSGQGPHVTIAVDRDGSIAKEMSVPTMPMIFVLDGGGVVRYAHAGYHGEEDDNALREEVAVLSRRMPTEEVPLRPEISEAEEMIAAANRLEPAADGPSDIGSLKLRASRDLEEGLYLGAFNLAAIATRRAPNDAEAWLILAAANTALNDREAARDSYQRCVTRAAGPRRYECAVLLATF